MDTDTGINNHSQRWLDALNGCTAAVTLCNPLLTSGA
jgi:hypothetical protein